MKAFLNFDFTLTAHPNRIRWIVAAACAVIAPAATSAIIGGPIINPTNGHTYYLLSQNNWTGSQSEAVTLGGNLATVRSAAEDSWIFNTFGAPSRELWIGLTDQALEGTFVWASGDQSSYRNWAAGEPNNLGNEDYVHMWTSSSWNDLTNTATQSGIPLHGVVEVIPEPATYALWAVGILTLLAAQGRRAVRQRTYA